MVLRKGDTLRGGQYEIEAVLGQGGFGITYKARDCPSKQWVVLKTPNENRVHSPDFKRYAKRFLKEGEMMEQLATKESHPHLVQVLGLFSEPAPDRSQGVQQVHYLVMDFIEGEDLSKAVKLRGRLPEATVLTIAQQIGSALEWMHRHELVHLDAHPGNIMLRSDGNAVLIDLGGAKEFVPSSQSSTGVFNDFAPYEQRARVEGIRQPSADIFCFAGSLYFAVTGQQPADSLARKLYRAALTPPRQLAPISEELNQMLMAGLELEAADRPQTIQEFLAYLQPKPEPEPKPIIEPSQPRGKTHIAWGWLIGCVVAYTFVGIGVSVGTHNIVLAVALAWAVALAVAWAGRLTSVAALAKALARNWALAVTLAGVLAVALTGALAMVEALTSAVALAEAWAGAWVGAWASAVAWTEAWVGVRTRTKAVVVLVLGVGLWRGSEGVMHGWEAFFLGLWWGTWLLTLGLLPGLAADAMEGSKVRAIALPTIASWLGLALGVFIYRAVHPV